MPGCLDGRERHTSGLWATQSLDTQSNSIQRNAHDSESACASVVAVLALGVAGVVGVPGLFSGSRAGSGDPAAAAAAGPR